MDRKIAKNYLYNIAYQILVIITPLITAPYISRVLHTDGVGLYSYTNTIATVFSLFAALGFSAYGQREIAYNQGDRHKQSIIFFEIVLFRAVLTLVVTSIFVIFSLFKPKYTIYLLPQALTVFSIMFDMAFYFQGIENFRIIVVRNAVIRFITVICTFVFVRTESDIGIYIALHAISPFICNIIYCFVIRKYIDRIAFADLHPTRHLRGSIEFFLPIIAVQTYSYLDKIMLGSYMETTVENGYYEQARKMTQIIVTAIIALNTVMMSRISSLYVKDKKEKIVEHYSQTFSIILMLTIPICAGLMLVSDNFVTWFFGEDFQKVAILMKLSCPIILFMCVGNFAGIQFLGPTGLQNKMTIAYIIAAVINVLLNVLMIPRWASIGAMIASIVAEAVSCIIQMFLLLKSEYRFNIFKGIWKYIAGTAVMILMMLIVHNIFRYQGIVATVCDVLIGVITYALCLIVFRERNVRELLTYLKNKLHFTKA